MGFWSLPHVMVFKALSQIHIYSVLRLIPKFAKIAQRKKSKHGTRLFIIQCWRRKEGRDIVHKNTENSWTVNCITSFWCHHILSLIPLTTHKLWFFFCSDQPFSIQTIITQKSLDQHTLKCGQKNTYPGMLGQAEPKHPAGYGLVQVPLIKKWGVWWINLTLK